MVWHTVSDRYKKAITNTPVSIAHSLLCHSAPADALSLPCPPEKMQCPRPEVGPRDAGKDSAYRQCLYLQLEHPRAFPRARATPRHWGSCRPWRVAWGDSPEPRLQHTRGNTLPWVLPAWGLQGEHIPVPWKVIHPDLPKKQRLWTAQIQGRGLWTGWFCQMTVRALCTALYSL